MSRKLDYVSLISDGRDQVQPAVSIHIANN